MHKGRHYIPMILIAPQDRIKKVTNNCLCIFQPSRCGVVAVTDLHEDDSKQHLQGLGVAGAKMVPWQGRGIALNRALSYMSHNVDFATYSRTGVFWRGGLLHSVSGVSYWTLRAGIVGHLRPYVNNGGFLQPQRCGSGVGCRPGVRCSFILAHAYHLFASDFSSVLIPLPASGSCRNLGITCMCA
jgi:hypothetical protein